MRKREIQSRPFPPLRTKGWGAGVLLLALLLSGCRTAQRDPNTVVFLIESSPASLDPRVGTDFASEHIDELLFDGLVRIDEQLHFQPALAESWEQPDPKTMVFHLRPGVRFSDGLPLTARDVVWTFQSMGIHGMGAEIGAKSSAVISPKAASYASVQSVEARDAETVVFHLRQPDNFLLTNLSSRAIGIVPEGSGKDFWRNPVGTGPFRFVSQRIDQDVIIERNPMSWQTQPKIARVRFAVVPDAITQSLELEKGSADVEVNSLPMDALPTLAARPNLEVSDTPGTEIQYLSFNTQDPILRDARVRQAIACAINRDLIVRTVYHGYARPAVSLLPPNQWAWTGDVARYNYDPARAERLLDEAGYRPGANGIRLRLSMKTSTDERGRLLGAIFQQQLARIGIALDLRSNEFATFYSDVVRGAFQMYSLYWIGGNEQPDIFSYVFSSARIPPHGANRGRYANPEVDALLDDAAQSPDMNRRRADYIQVQQILARDLPAVNLWYIDTLVAHNRCLTHVIPSPSGSYSFLETAELARP